MRNAGSLALPGRYCSPPLELRGQGALCPLPHTPEWYFGPTELGTGEREQIVAQMSQALTRLTKI